MASGNVKDTNSRQHKCSFIGCSKAKHRHPDLHFFRFPTRRPTVCKEWITKSANSLLINFSPGKILKYQVLCQEHFTDNSFPNLKRQRLKRNAVTTIYKAKNSNEAKINHSAQWMVSVLPKLE